MLTQITRPRFVNDPFAAFSRDIDRLFNAVTTPANGRPALVPPMTLWHDDEALVAEFDLPGFTTDDLELTVEDDTLLVKGEREWQRPENVRALHVERVSGSFERRVPLPFPVDDAKVEASLEHGVLRVRLPKAESARPRKIAIGGVSNAASLEPGETGTPSDN